MVEHQHFRTPTVLPVLGAITALMLASPLADRPTGVYIRASVLLAIGIGLWASTGRGIGGPWKWVPRPMAMPQGGV